MRRLAVAAALLAAVGCRALPAAGGPNTLTPEEEAAGWRLLFDGETTTGWRGFKQEGLPDGWQVVDGTLARTGPGGDIVTVDEFEDFVLRLEWNIAPGGNSGIFFRVSEAQDAVWRTGPEMQVLDDQTHPDGRSHLTSAGSNYSLHAAPAGIVRPPGEWNEVELEVRGDLVRHVLNGEEVVRYRLGSPDWEQRVAGSKFAALPDYGRVSRGHIALQDHGDAVRFRNLRVLDP